jgi:hypothetical protein
MRLSVMVVVPILPISTMESGGTTLVFLVERDKNDVVGMVFEMDVMDLVVVVVVKASATKIRMARAVVVAEMVVLIIFINFMVLR